MMLKGMFCGISIVYFSLIDFNLSSKTMPIYSTDADGNIEIPLKVTQFFLEPRKITNWDLSTFKDSLFFSNLYVMSPTSALRVCLLCSSC